MARRRKYTYHSDSLPLDAFNTVFVFDSNLAGLHKVGNSLVARDYFNAEFGVSEGITSANSYAIPFKDRFMRPLTLREISARVDKFIQYAKERPDKQFWIMLMGVGKKEYSSHEIAPMFSGCGTNCVFPQQWIPYLR